MFRRSSRGARSGTAQDSSGVDSLDAPTDSTSSGSRAGAAARAAVGRFARAAAGRRDPAVATGDGGVATPAEKATRNNGGRAGTRPNGNAGNGSTRGTAGNGATTAGNGAASRRPAEAGKGRPTPKRSEAERGRRQGIAGQGGRASGSGDKASSRADRNRIYEARKRGEDWALLPRDKGPVKALARDYIDCRRRVGEYYMWVLIVLVVILFARVPFLQTIAEPVVLALILAVIIEAWLIRRGLHRLFAQRMPKENTHGVTMYAVMRALQLRKLRVPAPRVRPGDSI